MAGSAASDSFLVNCVVGIEPNRETIARHLEATLMLVTALNEVIGYDNAAKVAKTAHAKNITLRQAASDLGLVKPEDFDKYVRPEKNGVAGLSLTRPRASYP